MAKRIPIGVDDFSELVSEQQNFLFVDKTLMIKELIDRGTKVSLIIRPRRWGKTLNMSMLRYFFSSQVNGYATHGIFDRLKIADQDQGSYIAKYQGKNPVVFISFKNIKQSSWVLFLSKFSDLVASIYREFSRMLLESDKLSDDQKNSYQMILDRKTDQSQLENSLKFLSECLYAHYGQKVVVLIDEYDTPLNAAYGQAYFEVMVDFFKSLLGAALKGNDALEKGLMTGILRLSKNKMLSDINNLALYSLMEKQYSTHFGFSEEELEGLFSGQTFPIDREAVRRWYNGYRSGEAESIYNPWSVLCFIQSEGALKAYWIKTGDEDLLRKVFLESSIETKEKLDILMRGGVIESIIDDYISFDQIKDNNDQVIWSLLWALGYLKTTGEGQPIGSRYRYKLLIPNHEIDCSYRDVFHAFVESLKNDDQRKYHSFLKDLVQGHVEAFVKELQSFLLSAASYYDFERESNYHTFLLGLISSLRDTHRILSNQESGDGRPDLVLIPMNASNPLAIIFELKRAESGQEPIVYEQLAMDAMAQINQKNYDALLKTIPTLKQVLKICLVFYGKHFLYKAVKEDLKAQ